MIIDNLVVNSQYEKVDNLLKNARHLFIELLKTSSNAIAVFDEAGDFIYINGVAQKMLGINDDTDNININLFDFVDDIEKTKVRFSRDETITFETSFGFSNKVDKGLYKVSVNPIFEHGKICSYLSILSDISEYTQQGIDLKAKSEQLSQLNIYVEHILKESKVALWRMYFVDESQSQIEGKLIIGSPTLIKDMTLTQSDISNIVSLENQEIFAKILRKILLKGNENLVQSLDLEVKNPYTNETYYRRHTLTRINNNEKEEAICAIHDITDIISQKMAIEMNNFKLNLLMDGSGLIPWQFDVNTMSYIYEKNNSLKNGSVHDIKKYITNIDSSNRVLMTDFFEKMSNGVDFTNEYDYCHNSENNPTYFKVYFTPYLKNENGKVTQYVGYTQNITNARLLLEELQVAKAKAENADQLKSQFLANMSHEIRTPLNAIVGFSEMLSYARTQEEKQKWQNHIYNNSDILIHLINDILDLSKIESGMISIVEDEFDFVSFFEETASTLKARIINKNVKFLVNSPCSKLIIKTDKSRIGQIITNYVTNAIKHTSIGHIKLWYEIANNKLTIHVEDTGRGISDINQAKLFSRFEKLDKVTQGTGLGLAIIKAITNIMGGECGCKSILDEGSHFWATIRISVIEECFDKKDSVECENKQLEVNIKLPENIRILVAEDNESNFILIKTILEEYNVTRCVNGLEAVVRMKNEEYDIILMDMRMPIMNGDDAIKEIRRFNKNIPIIVLTSNVFDVDKKRAFNAGANDFLSKPIRRNNLLNAIIKQTQ